MSIYLVFAICILIDCLRRLWLSTRRPSNFPPGPKFLPIFGNSLELRKEAIRAGGQHQVFQRWSMRYNSNILGLKLGNDFVIVVLSYPLVNKIHMQEVFEGRPDNFFFRLRTMGTRRGITGTDGNLWYEHRQFAMKQMRHIGYGRNQMNQHIENEIRSLLTYLAELNGKSFWPNRLLAETVINVLWTMVAGKRFQRGDDNLDRLLDLMNRRSKAFDMSGGFLAQFPILRFIAPNRTGYNLICQLNTELYDFITSFIEEHKRNYTEAKSGNDFIYAYLKEKQTNMVNPSFSDTQLIMTILDFFIAGSQTTSITIEICLMLLALQPDIQERIFKEITIYKNANSDFPHLSQRSKFPYADAFIMEVQRLYSIIPISGPRRVLHDTNLAGYDIPKNATILISLHSVLMDENHWGDPENFRPERFLKDQTAEQTFKDAHYIPFAQGRRRCLGDNLARACLFSFLIKILENFHIALSDNQLDQPTMNFNPGIILSTKPYKIRFVKRFNIGNVYL